MKTTLLIAMIVMAATTAFAQNFDAPYDLTHFNGLPARDGGTININFNDTTQFAPITETNRFMLGWQWTVKLPWIINKRLHTNLAPSTWHGWLAPSLGSLPDFTPVNWMWSPRSFYDSWLSHSYEWRPCAPIQDTMDLWKPVVGDTTGAIFGFKNLGVGTNDLNPTSSTFMNRVLTHSPTQTYPVLAMSRPTQNKNNLFLQRRSNVQNINSAGTMIDTLHQAANRDGNRWYISIHCRRTSNNAYGPSLPNDTILSIRMKWFKFPLIIETKNDSGIVVHRDTVIKTKAIKLDSVATSASIFTHPRGKMDRALTAVSGDTIFAIRRNMLPAFSTNPDSASVTLSAYFRNYNHANPADTSKNPYFSAMSGWSRSPNANDIDSMDVQVWYHGKCDVAVEWVRLETPLARALYRGTLDSVHAAYTGRDLIDIATKNAQPQYQNKRPRILYFYGLDEIDPTPCNYRSHKYLNTLFNRRFITEGGIQTTYKHLVNQHAYWGGAVIRFGAGLPNPIKPRTIYGLENDHILDTGEAVVDRFWLGRGNGWYREGFGKDSLEYMKNYLCHDCPNNMGWGFPVGTPGYSTKMPDKNISQDNKGNTLCAFEGNTTYFGWARTDVLYGTKPWYNYVATHSTWHSGLQRKPNKNNPNLIDTLPMITGNISYWGESLNFQYWYNLILGCRGFLNDGYHTDDRLDNFDSLRLGRPVRYRDSSNTQVPVFRERGFDDKGRGTDQVWRLTGSVFDISSDSLNYAKIVNGQKDTVGTATLLDYKIGPDFYMRNSDSLMPPGFTPFWAPYLNRPYHGTTTYLDTIYKTSYMTNTLPPRGGEVYIGMLTDRYVTMKMYDLIRSNETELMNMELMAYMGKGFNFVRNSRGDDTTLYTKAIDMRWGMIKTKELDSSAVEPWETKKTFVDVSWLRKKGTSTDSMFYIGVVNRRLSPLVKTSTAPAPLYQTHTFIPKISFDSMVTSNPTLKYKQLDSREITIPFNYRHPDGRLRLLRVQQLTADGEIGLDTVVAHNARLPINFQPGEGKMYRITVIAARSAIASGELTNQNQRKIVGFPMYNNQGSVIKPTTSIIYHATYHRFDSTSGRWKVYYRRSVPQEQGKAINSGVSGLGENTYGGILWENNELCLTDNGLLFEDGRSMDSLHPLYSAGVPSIAVRFDSLSNQVNCHVVFCADPKSTIDTLKLYQCEMVLPAQGQVILVAPASVIDSVEFVSRWRIPNSVTLTQSEIFETFGAPTIGVASGGNFYAYATNPPGTPFGRHISLRWKEPNQQYFSLPADTVYFDSLGRDNAMRAYHPSLTTYVRTGLGERDAALVWEQSTNPTHNVRNNVYYTRVRSTGAAGVSHFLPKNLDSVRRCVTNTDSTVAMLSDTIPGSNTTLVVQHRFPMVYRGVEEYKTDTTCPNCSLRPLIAAHWDRIVWQTETEQQSTYTCVRAIDIADSSAYSSFDHWWAQPTSRIYSSTPNFGVSQPTIANGGVKSNGFTNISDSAFVINVQTNQYTNDPPLSQPRIVQLPLGYWSVVNATYFTPSPQWQSIIGTSPRLSAEASLTSNAQWVQGRRLYHSQYPQIFASAEYFAKQTNQESIAIRSHIGFGVIRRDGMMVNSKKILMSSAMIDGKDYPFTVRRNKDNNSELSSYQNDTVTTAEFTAGQLSTMDIENYGLRLDECTRLDIVDCSSGKRTKLILNQRELDASDFNDVPSKRTVTGYRLLRGARRLYRLELVNHCGASIAPIQNVSISHEQTFDGKEKSQLSESDTIHTLDLAYDEENSIDGGVTVAPNPTDSRVTIFVRGFIDALPTTSYSVDICSVLGDVLYTNKVDAGSSITLDVSTWNVGMYYVRCQSLTRRVSVPLEVYR